MLPPRRHPARSRRIHPRQGACSGVDSATPLRSAQNDGRGRRHPAASPSCCRPAVILCAVAGSTLVKAPALGWILRLRFAPRRMTGEGGVILLPPRHAAAPPSSCAQSQDPPSSRRLLWGGFCDSASLRAE